MSEQDLAGIEAENDRLDWPSPHVPALVAEIRRLRAAIENAQWNGTAYDTGAAQCPWCGREREAEGWHEAECPVTTAVR